MARVRKPSALRNLTLFFLLAVLFGGVAASIRFINQEPEFILPERQVITPVPKEENGYHALQRALNMVPRNMSALRPVQVPDPAHPGKTMLYEAHDYELGKIIKVDRPDTDPELLAFLHKAEPALDRLREMLELPVFQLPYKPKVFQRNQYDFNVLAALGSALARVENKPEEGIAILLDLIRVDRRLAEQPSLSSTMENLALRECRMIARCCNSPELLAALQQQLLALGVPCPNRRTLLEKAWVLLDNTLAGDEPENEENPPQGVRLSRRHRHNDFGRRLEQVYVHWRATQITQLIIRHKDELYAMLERPMDEIQQWRKEQPVSHGKRLYWVSVESQVADAAYDALYRNSAYWVTLVAIAMERFRLEHGEYPETLESLAPAYLDSLPDNPYTNKPFVYQRIKRCYAIASKLEEGKNLAALQPHSLLIPVEEVRAGLSLSGAPAETTSPPANE